MASPFFNAHHSPIGGFATLTLGMPGCRGGMGLELAGPANEAFYIGVETPEGGTYRTLPFHDEAKAASADYDVEGLGDMSYKAAVQPFLEAEITRTFGAAVDEWRAGDLTFSIYSPPHPIPDLENNADSEAAKLALVPSVVLELTIDNSTGTTERKAFVGYAGSDRYAGMRVLDVPGQVGVGQGTSTAIATVEAEGVYAGLGWQPEAVLTPRLTENLRFMLGSIGLIVGVVPAGQVRTFRFAAAFFRSGQATTGIPTEYVYRRWFISIEHVLEHALTNAHATISRAIAFDNRISAHLSPERRFMLAQAVRSYYGSSQLLQSGKDILWVVHEGEYRMMNTFDLTVDQAFFELAMNPWTVRNVLDQFVERYSYFDGVRYPGSSEVHAGGIAFTHDMGVANAFAPPGRSGYEQAGLRGCFSHMSSEELLNWVLTAGLYVSHTKDWLWAEGKKAIFLQCLESLENRDNPETEKRNGVMGLDGARCEGGAEITTYDSLDASLGQARNNVYLAVKGWAAYRLLEKVLVGLRQLESAGRAGAQAARAAETVVGAVDADGLLPAVIGEGVHARIIPAIEGLVYPYVTGLDPEFPELYAALKAHFLAVLRPGVCRFADRGWKLSSTSDNSWLSKIYLCQFVAEQVFGLPPDAEADAAHVRWLTDAENAYYAWSDQMLAGSAVGSRYYPRGVTAALWLSSGSDPIGEIRALLAPYVGGATQPHPGLGPAEHRIPR